MPSARSRLQVYIRRRQKRRKTNTFQRILSSKLLSIMFAMIVFATMGGGFLLYQSSASVDGSAVSGQHYFGIQFGCCPASWGQNRINQALDNAVELGAKWVRVDIYWATIQQAGPNSYEWGDDHFFRAAQARGLRVLAMLAYTPAWNRPASAVGEDESRLDKYGPVDTDAFGRFAKATAEHYKTFGVQHYEIWNEPNVEAYWRPHPDPITYTKLLKSAYSGIKQAQPRATVLAAGTAPSYTQNGNYSPVDFLEKIYLSGGKDSFDALGWHPYTDDLTPPTRNQEWSAWWQMNWATVNGRPHNARSIMRKYGDNKKIWLTEYGTTTSGRGGNDEYGQMVNLAEAFRLVKSYDWTGPLFWYRMRDSAPRGHWNKHHYFGLIRDNGTKKPAWDLYRRMALQSR
jgi:polysaccharide biosynthesis protein PslG